MGALGATSVTRPRQPNIGLQRTRLRSHGELWRGKLSACGLAAEAGSFGGRMAVAMLLAVIVAGFPALAGPGEPIALEVLVPEFPQAAIMARMQGTVRIRAAVGPDGKVLSVSILKGVNALLDHASVIAVEQWLFEPAAGAERRSAAIILEYAVHADPPAEDRVCQIGPTQVKFFPPNRIRMVGWYRPGPPNRTE